MWRILIICLAAILPSSCKEQPQQHTEVRIFAAASLTDVITGISANFVEEHNVEIISNFAASGSLARQIASGARADIFISANPAWMDKLEQQNFIDAGSRCDIISNQLVIIASNRSSFVLSKPQELAGLSFQHLVMGNPAFAPVGQYAKAWLENKLTSQGDSLWSELEGRIAMMPDTRSTLVQVSNNAELVGIVYRSDFELARGELKLLYAIPTDESPPIQYSAALIHGYSPMASAYLETLKTTFAQNQFSQYGFTPLTTAP